MSVHGLPEQPAFFRASLFAGPPGIALLKKPFTDEPLVEAAATMIARPRGVLRLRD
jgi:hypothetical protein